MTLLLWEQGLSIVRAWSTGKHAFLGESHLDMEQRLSFLRSGLHVWPRSPDCISWGHWSQHCGVMKVGDDTTCVVMNSLGMGGWGCWFGASTTPWTVEFGRLESLLGVEGLVAMHPGVPDD